MSNSRAAYRYALAFISVAEEGKRMAAVRDDFAMLARLLRDSRELALFFESPVVSGEKKRAVLAELFKGKIDDLTFSFVVFLASKQRESLLPQIIEEFAKLEDERNGVVNVAVRSATPLTAQQQAALSEGIKRVAGKTVRLTQTTDKDLIGGLTVRFDDTVWDGSVRRQLELLEQRLLAGAA